MTRGEQPPISIFIPTVPMVCLRMKWHRMCDTYSAYMVCVHMKWHLNCDTYSAYMVCVHMKWHLNCDTYFAYGMCAHDVASFVWYLLCQWYVRAWSGIAIVIPTVPMVWVHMTWHRLCDTYCAYGMCAHDVALFVWYLLCLWYVCTWSSSYIILCVQTELIFDVFIQQL